MSPRTYIGPFGRILPLPDGQDARRLETSVLTIDETRHPMATYQLPPPERLQFGSDVSSGFTDPTRYNTIGHSRRSSGSGQSNLGEPSRNSREEQLPSLRHILTPPAQPAVSSPPIRAPRSSPEPLRRQGNELIHAPRPTSDNIGFASHHPQQTSQPPPRLPTQVQPSGAVGPQRQGYRPAPSTQSYPVSYGYQPNAVTYQYPSTFGHSQSTSYSSQVQPSVSSIPFHQSPRDASFNPQIQQNFPPPETAPAQQMQPLNTQPLYFQSQKGPYPMAAMPTTVSETSKSTPSNSVKPQPRVVAEQDIPGEGPSWVYEDGTTCKKVIDGEMVNAQWGVTKAGKPRKRLAIACTTCREKKIKCDPAEPKCVQCEKFGRECRFTTAFRNQRGSPDSPSYDFQARTSLMNIKVEHPKRESKISHLLRSPSVDSSRRLKRRSSPPEAIPIKTEVDKSLSQATTAKRQRSSIPESSKPSQEFKPSMLKTAHSAPEPPCPSWEDDVFKVNVDSLSPFVDPFDVHPGLSHLYLKAYCDHTAYKMFPRRQILQWAQCSTSKSHEDLMSTYALLAVGSIFSAGRDRSVHGSKFCRIANDAVECLQGIPSLQLFHTRFLLALYYFALGEHQLFWDYSGLAVRTASRLRYHLERECVAIPGCEEETYQLSSRVIAECRRRAFWSAYLIDRFTGFDFEHACILQADDIYLRLPGDDTGYEKEFSVSTPYFKNGNIDGRLCEITESSNLGSMAFMVQVVAISSDIRSHILRASHQSNEQYMNNFESFYQSTQRKLTSWLKNLPLHLDNSKSDAAVCISRDDISAFINLHATYHLAIVQLNRYVRDALLPTSIIGRNIRKAYDHARQLLQMMQRVDEAARSAHRDCASDKVQHNPEQILFSDPSLGYAISSAIDVLSAAGSIASCADIILLMEDGLGVLEKLSRFWASARLQRKAVRHRLERLIETVNSKAAAGKKAWRCLRSLDEGKAVDQDIFYNNGNSHLALLDHLGWTTAEDEVLLVE